MWNYQSITDGIIRIDQQQNTNELLMGDTNVL